MLRLKQPEYDEVEFRQAAARVETAGERS